MAKIHLYNPETELTTGQAARLLGVHVVTVNRWCAEGRVPHVERYVGNHTPRRIIQRDWIEGVLSSGTLAEVRARKPSTRVKQVKERKRVQQFSVARAAEMLGISRYTVYLWQGRGKLPKPLTEDAVWELALKRKQES